MVVLGVVLGAGSFRPLPCALRGGGWGGGVSARKPLRHLRGLACGSTPSPPSPRAARRGGAEGTSAAGDVRARSPTDPRARNQRASQGGAAPSVRYSASGGPTPPPIARPPPPPHRPLPPNLPPPPLPPHPPP